MRLALAIFACILPVAATFAQTHPRAEAMGIEEVYLAKDDGTGKAGEQVTEFRTTDIPIHCIILLSSDSKTVIKMNFVAVAVAGVRPETKVVSTSYTTAQGQNRVNFTGRPDGRWTAGKYRVDLFVNGKVVRNVQFDIKGSAIAGSNVATKSFQSQRDSDSKPKRKSKTQP